MNADSLWYEVHAEKGGPAVVTLRRCRNCGEIKVTSRPCGFDHLAAVMEFRRDSSLRSDTEQEETCD